VVVAAAIDGAADAAAGAVFRQQQYEMSKRARSRGMPMPRPTPSPMAILFFSSNESTKIVFVLPAAGDGVGETEARTAVVVMVDAGAHRLDTAAALKALKASPEEASRAERSASMATLVAAAVTLAVQSETTARTFPWPKTTSRVLDAATVVTFKLASLEATNARISAKLMPPVTNISNLTGIFTV